MSYVIAAPQMMTAAASDLATIGDNLSAAHAVAATRTTAVLPAAADEVSTGIAALFSAHAASYQATAAKAAAFNDQFVHNLTVAGAFSYTDLEAILTAFLQSPLGTINNLIGGVPGLNTNIVFVLALLELPFLIPFLIVTAPIWLPLLLVLGPIALTFAIA